VKSKRESKATFTLEQNMEVQKGSRNIALIFP